MKPNLNPTVDYQLTLHYGTIVTKVIAPDHHCMDDLRAALTVPNPYYNPNTNPDVDPTCTFMIEDRILSGLVPYVEQWSASQGLACEVIGKESAEIVEPTIDCVPGLILRDYQFEALKKILTTNRGVIDIATGGGKTELAVAVIFSLNIPNTVYVVPDIASGLEMQRRFIKRGLTAQQVGFVSGQSQEWNRPVTIIVIDSLSSGLNRGNEQALELARTCELLFIDEVHHLGTAPTWRKIATSIPAKRRYGMSGTPYEDPRSRTDIGFLHAFDSWITGTLGPTIVHLSVLDLQASGHLSPCTIYWFPTRVDDFVWELKDWRRVYERCVTDNPSRNQQIAMLCENLLMIGGKPLVLVKHLEHGRAIQRLLMSYGITSACSYGNQVTWIPGEVQNQIEIGEILEESEGYLKLAPNDKVINWFEQGAVKVLIGSMIYDEALNIPFVTDLINAAGGRRAKRFRQKVGRALRLSEGKAAARIWDPYDESHPYLLAHSRERLKVASDEGFPVTEAPWIYYGFRWSRTHCERKISMQLKRITVDASFTINTGNFSNMKPGVSVSADLDPGDDLNACAEQLGQLALGLTIKEAWRQAYWAGQFQNRTVQDIVQEYFQNIQGPTNGSGNA